MIEGHPLGVAIDDGRRNQVVALDSTSNTLLPGGRHSSSGAAGVEAGGVLQRAGPAPCDSVLLCGLV